MSCTICSVIKNVFYYFESELILELIFVMLNDIKINLEIKSRMLIYIHNSIRIFII